jgi:hypothetical protein
VSASLAVGGATAPAPGGGTSRAANWQSTTAGRQLEAPVAPARARGTPAWALGLGAGVLLALGAGWLVLRAQTNDSHHDGSRAAAPPVQPASTAAIPTLAQAPVQPASEPAVLAAPAPVVPASPPPVVQTTAGPPAQALNAGPTIAELPPAAQPDAAAGPRPADWPDGTRRTWSGLWSDTTSRYSFVLDLERTGSQLRGAFTYTRRVDPGWAQFIGETGLEYVRGTYRESSRSIEVSGYAVSAVGHLGMDRYRIQIHDDGSVSGRSFTNTHDWSGHLSAHAITPRRTPLPQP